MSSFQQLNLDANVFKALSACGYTTPTEVQAKSIPAILEGKDVVASAQTGTGKTAAFVLPALHRLTLKKAGHHPRVLILTPTRELASQITTAATQYGKFLRFNIISLVGGMPYRQQLRNLSRPVDIIVATPGRLLDHMKSGRLNLSQIEMLVLDEADRMLDMGFIDDVNLIADATPEARQTLLFSATVDNKLAKVIRHLLKDPVRIDLSNEKITPAQITQELYMADHIQHKTRLLIHLLNEKNIFKAIIFSATKVHADQLAGDLQEQGYAAGALHGDLKQNIRNRTIEQLRKGKIQFLVATDVAARGINITDITHVINYDLPKFSEDYVHRIGRTGRAGKTGLAISFALPSDTRHIQKIERYMNQKIERKIIAGLEPKKQADRSAPQKAKNKKSAHDRKDKNFSYENKSKYKNKKSGSTFAGSKHVNSDRYETRSDSGKRFRSDRDDNRSGSPKRFGSDRHETRSDSGKRFRSDRDDNRSGSPKRFSADTPKYKNKRNETYPDSRERSNKTFSQKKRLAKSNKFSHKSK